VRLPQEYGSGSLWSHAAHLQRARQQQTELAQPQRTRKKDKMRAQRTRPDIEAKGQHGCRVRCLISLLLRLLGLGLLSRSEQNKSVEKGYATYLLCHGG
jgi:hypothetical protein